MMAGRMAEVFTYLPAYIPPTTQRLSSPVRPAAGDPAAAAEARRGEAASEGAGQSGSSGTHGPWTTSGFEEPILLRSEVRFNKPSSILCITLFKPWPMPMFSGTPFGSCNPVTS